jgi:ATP-dependent DNA helicase RecG
MSNLNLQSKPIRFLKGVGPAKAKLFANLGVETIEDLLMLFPRRYEDRRNMRPIAQVMVDELQTVSGRIVSVNARQSFRSRRPIIEAVLDDGSGRLTLIWFNQAYLKSYLRNGQRLIAFGKVDSYRHRLQMVAPEFELIDADDDPAEMKKIVPVYPLTKGLTQKTVRKTIARALAEHIDEWTEVFSDAMRDKHHLSGIRDTLRWMHNPQDFEQQQLAMRRVSFEEFFFFQISVLLRRQYYVQQTGYTHKCPDAWALKYIQTFPFALTQAQKRVIRELQQDMSSDRPMLRLLQGDVGSGKTIVALFGCAVAALNQQQSALMAPTEILARQHYQTILRLMEQKILPRMKVALLVSSLKAKQKRTLLDAIAMGMVDMVVGTHALISDAVNFKALSFVVVDEQHKFGVRQRAILAEKGTNPDVLIMTATPIPRTLCLTLYGDLELSVIDERPAGRGEGVTRHFASEKMSEVIQFVRGQLAQGRQAYVIYPLIEESEKMDLKAGECMHQVFREKYFADHRVAWLHGQLGRSETIDIMQRFQKGEIHMLVATTVLEVGIDVANATVMVIEHAERFGLAQLHQLRGRIGRGAMDSHCILVGDPKTDDGQQRINTMVATRDGFKVAEKDLELRGPGHYFGRYQHGFSELTMINPGQQLDVLKIAREEAKAVMADDPRCEQPDHAPFLEIVRDRYPTYLSMLSGG